MNEKEVDTILHPGQASKGKNQGCNIDSFYVYFLLISKKNKIIYNINKIALSYTSNNITTIVIIIIIIVMKISEFIFCMLHIKCTSLGNHGSNTLQNQISPLTSGWNS